jgi:hypothetical protein
VYFKGAHGRFRAERNGKNLAIVFGTILNQPVGRKFDTSAVIVNLDFTPDQIYTESSSID